MFDFETEIRTFLRNESSPYLILFLFDYRSQIEATCTNYENATDLKADVIEKYCDCYNEVKPAENRLYERFAWTEWCVWQRIFEGIEKNKNDVFNTSASSSSSEMVGVRGMKRLLAMEESIDNWTVPEAVDNSLTINDIDINKEFFKYQVEALSVFQKDKFFCWRNDLQKLMALSSIVFLDGVHGMLDFLSVDVSRALNTFILSSLGSAFVMQTEARRDLEDILLSYKKKYESWDAIKKIANLHEKYKSDAAVLCIMETILALIPEMNVFDMKKSEMRVQSSFIHNFVKSILKTDCLHSPHCSNVANNFYSTRPDYLVDVWSSKTSLYVNAFGECKPSKASTDSCNKDIYRLALFSQVAMKEKKLTSVMSFFSKDNQITFYIMKKVNSLYYFVNFAEVIVPTTEKSMASLYAYFDEIGEIRRLYSEQCHDKSGEDDRVESLPWSVLNGMACKKSKSTST